MWLCNNVSGVKTTNANVKVTSVKIKVTAVKAIVTSVKVKVTYVKAKVTSVKVKVTSIKVKVTAVIEFLIAFIISYRHNTSNMLINNSENANVYNNFINSSSN